MNVDDRYLVWQLVAGKRTYSVLRWDRDFIKRSSGSLAEIWPAAAFCVLDASPGAGEPLLPDCLLNTEQSLLISSDLKQALVEANVDNVEFWPLKIIDRTGRSLGQPYFFVHLLNTPDCLDLDASGATRSRLFPGMAEKVQRLVFARDPERHLFSPRTFSSVTFLSWELAGLLAKGGFSGFRFMGLFDYGIKGDLPPHPARYKVDALCNENFKNNLARRP